MPAGNEVKMPPSWEICPIGGMKAGPDNEYNKEGMGKGSYEEGKEE